jgi:hypothetical protein
LAPDTIHFVTHSRYQTSMRMYSVLWRRA